MTPICTYKFNSYFFNSIKKIGDSKNQSLVPENTHIYGVQPYASVCMWNHLLVHFHLFKLFPATFIESPAHSLSFFTISVAEVLFGTALEN